MMVAYNNILAPTYIYITKRFDNFKLNLLDFVNKE